MPLMAPIAFYILRLAGSGLIQTVPQQETTEQPSNYPRVMGIQKTRTKYQNSQQQDSLKRSPRTKVLGWAILLEAS